MPIDLFLPPEPVELQEPFVVKFPCQKCRQKGIQHIDKRNIAATNTTSRLLLEVAADMFNDEKKSCDACGGHGFALFVAQGYLCSRRSKDTIWSDPCPDVKEDMCCQPLWTIEQSLFESKIVAERGVAV